MDFYVGDPTVGTNKVMTLQNDLITFHKPTTPEIGATVDDSNYVKKLGETGQLITGSMEFQGTTSQTFKFSMGGPSNFAQYRRFEIYNSEVVSYRVIKCTNALGLQSNLINSYTDVDLVFQRNSNNILQFNTINQLQFLQGAQKSFIYEEEFVDVGTINAFRIRNTENTNTAYISFGVGDVLDVLQIYKTGITSAVEMTIPNVLCNAFDSFGNNDVVFSRNGIEYMKFEGTLSSVELAQGVKSNIYDSIGNANVSFRRNFIDFFYLRNNQVETNSGISLYSNDAKINTINTTGDNDMVFQRNGVEYLKFVGATSIVNVGTSIALSSNYLYCNYLRSRSILTNDMVFEGANTTGSGYTEFMRYRKGEEDVMFSKDAYIIQDKQFYFHKGSSVNSYITSTNIAGVNHTNFINEDPNGDLRFFANNGIRLYITPSKVSVPPPYTLEGDLVDTSDKTKKYDIKSIEHNFTDIMKQIEPKTFKMEEEKELGISKNHIGFIADEIKEVIPTEWENIVMTDDEGIKKLSYVKLNSILWGVCREQESKIEHLETRLFEVENIIKDLTKPKPKTKAKAKN